MNKNEKLLRAVWGISDDKVAESENDAVETKSGILRRMRQFRTVAPLAAACLVIAVAFLATPMFLEYSLKQSETSNGTVADTDYSAQTNAPTSVTSATSKNTATQTNIPTSKNTAAQTDIPIKPPPQFIGLPKAEHCLPASSDSASRIGVGSLPGIFDVSIYLEEYQEKNSVQAFAFVRVLETVKGEYVQVSTVEVISTVWSKGQRTLPETIVLSQVYSVGYGCPCCTGELMREGGIFLLPLWYDFPSSGWDSWSYFDVLFEVDDEGLIWSHSPYPAFNRFDGKHTSVLTNAILAIANDNGDLSREIAHSPLGFAADYSVFAVVTAVSSETVNREWGEPHFTKYTVRIDEIESIPLKYYNWGEEWKFGTGDELTAWYYSKNWLLEPGERYLAAIAAEVGFDNVVRDEYGYPLFVFVRGSVAKINEDGTITPLNNSDDNNVFNAYDGYTVNQIAELAELAQTWQNKYEH
ncbi:MAG: hypothetical protein FWF82_00295 [Oscillospiraceae bacterium]|nr:hypothetical protein [Oscillospiraceae bacterium]